MADEVILIDTSILIDYYRKTDKHNSIWMQLVLQDYSFAASVVTKYEIFSGAMSAQVQFWETIFESIIVLPLDTNCINKAVEINTVLKKKRKQKDIADLFIAATAVNNNLPIATLNKNHFQRIESLKLIV
jgi:tRNA(fMet)-specific endonuclease VapC